jgi:threonine aldolase
VHLDGARIFNAAAVLGKPVADLTRKADSVMFCLSKGLGAPVGSMLVGSRDFMGQARVYRKALGGGMRQAGVLAAAGLIALERMPARLPQDRANARFLADGISAIAGLRVIGSVPTNIVVFNLGSTGLNSHEVCRRMAEQGVLASGIDADHIRMVTHLDVDRGGCARAIAAVEAACGRGRRAGAAD